MTESTKLLHSKNLVDNYFKHFCSKSNPDYKRYRMLDRKLTKFHKVTIQNTYHHGSKTYHSHQLVEYGDSYKLIPELIDRYHQHDIKGSNFWNHIKFWNRPIRSNVHSNGFGLITIDPPYKLPRVTKKTKQQFNRRAKDYDVSLTSMTDGFSLRIIPKLIQLLRDPSKINIQIFCSKPQRYTLEHYFRVNYGCNESDFSWVTIGKTNSKFSKDNIRNNAEYCLWVHKNLVFKNQYHLNGAVYKISQNQRENALFHHPTVKPLYIVRNLIACATRSGDTVLDCFAGSFTSALACKLLGLDGTFIDYSKSCAEEGIKRLVASNEIDKNLLKAERYHLTKIQTEATREKKSDQEASKRADDDLEHNLLLERIGNTVKRLIHDERSSEEQKSEVEE